MFLATTEDVIDIGDLDYEWQLTEASKKLETFVKSFELYKIGLSEALWSNVCPEANIELFECIEGETQSNVDAFYQECLDYIDEIFKKGAEDLKQILDAEYFPERAFHIEDLFFSVILIRNFRIPYSYSLKR